MPDSKVLELMDSLVDLDISAEPETSSILEGTYDALKHVETYNGSEPDAPSNTPQGEDNFE